MNLLHLSIDKLEPGFSRDIQGRWMPFIQNPGEEMPFRGGEGWAPVDFRFVIRTPDALWCERVIYTKGGSPVGELQVGAGDFLGLSEVEVDDYESRQFGSYIEDVKERVHEDWRRRAEYIEGQTTWNPTYVGIWYDDQKHRCEAVWDVTVNVGTGIELGMESDEGNAGWLPVRSLHGIPDHLDQWAFWPDGSAAFLESASRKILAGLIDYWSDHVIPSETPEIPHSIDPGI